MAAFVRVRSRGYYATARLMPLYFRTHAGVYGSEEQTSCTRPMNTIRCHDGLEMTAVVWAVERVQVTQGRRGAKVFQGGFPAISQGLSHAATCFTLLAGCRTAPQIRVYCSM
jgi:hypothetical protein